MNKLILFIFFFLPFFKDGYSQIGSELSYYFNEEILDLIIKTNKSKVKGINVSINYYSYYEENEEVPLFKEKIEFKFLNDSVVQQIFKDSIFFYNSTTFWLIKNKALSPFDIDTNKEIPDNKFAASLNPRNTDSTYNEFDSYGNLISYKNKYADGIVKEWKLKSGDTLDLHKRTYEEAGKSTLQNISYSLVLNDKNKNTILKQHISKGLTKKKKYLIENYTKKYILFDSENRVIQIKYIEFDEKEKQYSNKCIADISYSKRK